MHNGVDRPVHEREAAKNDSSGDKSLEVIKEFQGQTCAKICGPLGTREVHKPILGHTWVNRDNTWERVKLSAYAGGYTQEFSMKLLKAVSRESVAGTFVEHSTRKEQFLQTRAELKKRKSSGFEDLTQRNHPGRGQNRKTQCQK